MSTLKPISCLGNAGMTFVFCCHYNHTPVSYEFLIDEMEASLLWSKSIKIFPILEQKVIIGIRTKAPANKDPFISFSHQLLCEAEINAEELQQVVTELSRFEIAENVYETILNEIDTKLRQEIVPKFWNYFVQNDNDSETEFHQFQRAVHDLHSDYLQFQELLIRLQAFKKFVRFQNVQHQNQNEVAAFNEMLKVTLLSQLPANFERIIYSFYHTSFKVFVNSHLTDVPDDEECSVDLDDAKCNGCDNSAEQCRCQDLVCAFNKTNQFLTNMSLLDRLSGFTLTSLIQERIALHVRETCEGISDTSHIENLEKVSHCDSIPSMLTF